MKWLTPLSVLASMLGALLLWRTYIFNRDNRHKDSRNRVCDIAREHELSDHQQPFKHQIAGHFSTEWKKRIDPDCFLHLFRKQMLDWGFEHLKAAGQFVRYDLNLGRIIDKANYFELYRKLFKRHLIIYFISSLQFIIIFSFSSIQDRVAENAYVIPLLLVSLGIYIATFARGFIVARRFHALHFMITEQPYKFRFNAPTGLPAPAYGS